VSVSSPRYHQVAGCQCALGLCPCSIRRTARGQQPETPQAGGGASAADADQYEYPPPPDDLPDELVDDLPDEPPDDLPDEPPDDLPDELPAEPPEGLPHPAMANATTTAMTPPRRNFDLVRMAITRLPARRFH
jgi:hypothetical protein